MLKQVRSLRWSQWIRVKSKLTRGGRAKQSRIATVVDVWVENENQRPKNEDSPLLKSLLNSSKRLSRPSKKQQDLKLSINLTKVFDFYNLPPSPKCRKPRLPSNSPKMLSCKKRQTVSRL